ncbi:hypothetical protein [Thermoflexus sp.]|uniref:hypothetical protein n=1 Tax=Thermoflexus sp. TaxID=1969742 RepID=UPI0035E41924
MGSSLEAETFRDIDVAVFLDPLPMAIWCHESELTDRLGKALHRGASGSLSWERL